MDGYLSRDHRRLLQAVADGAIVRHNYHWAHASEGEPIPVSPGDVVALRYLAQERLIAAVGSLVLITELGRERLGRAL